MSSDPRPKYALCGGYARRDSTDKMKDSFSTEAEFEQVPAVGFKRQKPGFMRFVAEECEHGFHMLYAEYTDGNTEVVNNIVGGLPPWIEKGVIA